MLVISLSFIKFFSRISRSMFAIFSSRSLSAIISFSPACLSWLNVSTISSMLINPARYRADNNFSLVCNRDKFTSASITRPSELARRTNFTLPASPCSREWSRNTSPLVFSTPRMSMEIIVCNEITAILSAPNNCKYGPYTLRSKPGTPSLIMFCSRSTPTINGS